MSLVILSLVLSPVSVAADMSAISGVAGAIVSIVVVVSLLAAEVLPALSVTVAVMVWLPSEIGLLGVHVQVPPLTTIGSSAQEIGVLSICMITVAPFWPVPVIDGVESLVLVASSGVAITGAAGGVASTVNSKPMLADEVFPAVSVAITLAVCEPSATFELGASVYVLPEQIAPPTAAPSIINVTVSSLVQLPVKPGVRSLVRLSVLLRPVSEPAVISGADKASGVEVSMVTLRAGEAGEVLLT